MASLNDLMHRFYEKFFKSGDRLPVDVGGQITVDEINIGEVKQGARGENAEPWQVTLTGQTVTIAETQYRLHPDGITLIGPAASRPTVADAVAAVGKGVCYWAEDTGEVSMANSVSGTWRSLGVA